jgi:hypothetical protein
MRMQGDGGRHVAGAAIIGVRRIGVRRHALARIARALSCVAVCLALPLAGCASVGSSISQALGPSAPARDHNASIAFDSIDGLAQNSQTAMVRDLNEEAAAFHIAVVPSGSNAWYRIRSYVATHAEHRATSVAWAWDVYDSSLHHAVRLSGEEHGDTPAGKGGAIADEAVLRRVARAGMAQLADFMASTPPAPAAPPPSAAPSPPARSGGDVASREDAWTQVAAWGASLHGQVDQNP